MQKFKSSSDMKSDRVADLQNLTSVQTSTQNAVSVREGLLQVRSPQTELLQS